jgi:hypothetical protein
MATNTSTSNKRLTSKRNSFSVFRVIKLADSSKAVIFIPKQNHQEHIAVV